jgi:hypothetical protein
MEPTIHPDPPRTDSVRLLAIFHFLYAGFALVGIGFLFLHHHLMSTMFTADNWAKHPNPPPEGMLDMFVWFYVIFGALMLLGLVLNLLVAVSLRQRRRWMLCAVVSGLNCLHVPVGTTLGVFTLVVLNRDDVRRSFSS